MKLYLVAFSFYPLLVTFFIGIWFRIHILAAAMLFTMIIWMMLAPFILVFIDTILLPMKKENPLDKEGETDVVHQQESK